MVRPILLAAGTAWVLAGFVGLALAAFATEEIERLLPPLAIDTDALRGTIITVAVALLTVGLGHVAVLLGLRARRRLAWTAGILMCGLLAATMVALAAASATSAVADPGRAIGYLVGTAGAALGAGAYALVGAGLVSELRSGSVT